MKKITKPIDSKKGTTVGKTHLNGEGMVEIIYPQDTVAVRDYVAGRGYSGAVDWDGTSPTIGGQAITPQYIENGTAYVNREDADKAIADMEKRAGVIGMDGAEKARQEKYGESEDKALKNITDREEFSYDTESDPAFQAYREVYEELAEKAYRRVLNDNNTSVTGASNVVLSEAMEAQNDELRKLAGMVPELYENAFDRYIEEGEADRKDLDAITTLADSFYDRLYNQNLDATDRLMEAGENEREEKQRWIDNEREDVDAYYDHALDDIDIQKGNIDIEKGNMELEVYPETLRNEINADTTQIESRAMENALSRGFFIEADEASIPWLKEFKDENGNYTVSPQTMALAYDYQVYYNRERAKINAKMGW